MENRSHALIAGLFTLLLGIAAALSVLWFTGKREEMKSFEIQTRRTLTGLSPQAQVRYRGIGVGKVESIRLDPTDPLNTLILISVEADTPVTRGTVAKLGYQGVTGIAHILLEDAGRDRRALVAQNGHFPRIAMQDSLMQELSDVGGDVLRNARDLMAGMNELLSPGNQQALSRTLSNLEKTTENTAQLTAQLQHVLSSENVQRFDSMIANGDKTLAQAAPLFSEARVMVAHLQKTSDQVNSVLGSSQNSDTAELIPRVNALTVELAERSTQLSRVLQMLEESPQSLLFGRSSLPGPGEPGFVAPSPLHP